MTVGSCLRLEARRALSTMKSQPTWFANDEQGGSRQASALPCPAGRSVLVAEDRSAAGVRDRTGPDPDAHEIAHGTGRNTPG
jgi:hypothetical protein